MCLQETEKSLVDLEYNDHVQRHYGGEGGVGKDSQEDDRTPGGTGAEGVRRIAVDHEARSADRITIRNLQIMLRNMDPSGGTRATGGLYVKASHDPVSIRDISLRLQCGGCLGGRMEMGDKSERWRKEP